MKTKHAITATLAVLIVIILVIMVLIYTQNNTVSTPPTTQSTVENTTIVTIPPDQDTRVALVPKNDSEQPGMAQIISDGDSSHFQLSIAGDIETIASIRLYKGSCDNLGENIADLTGALDGNIQLFSRAQLLNDLPLAIQSESIDATKPAINCGDITEKNL